MEVAIRVDVVNWVIDDIAVTIEVLRIVWLPDKRVRADESAKLWVIVSAAIVVEAALWIKDVAGEAADGIADALIP